MRKPFIDVSVIYIKIQNIKIYFIILNFIKYLWWHDVGTFLARIISVTVIKIQMDTQKIFQVIMYVVLTAPIHFFFSKFGLQFFDPCHKVQSFLRVPDRNELLDLNYVRHVDYVIMPFPDSQLESLLENIKKWELLPPSDGLITTTQLIFLCPCSNKFAFKTEFIILKTVIMEEAKKHFANVQWDCVYMLQAENTYEVGSRRQFEYMLQKYRNHTVFLMEPDATPLRKFWLEILIQKLPISTFWVFGSHYISSNYWETSENTKTYLHINGNAVYHLTNAFIEFYFNAAEKHYSWAYDIDMTEYLHDPCHRRLFQLVNHLFFYTDVVLNIAKEVTNISQLEFPNTVIVHQSRPKLTE